MASHLGIVPLGSEQLTREVGCIWYIYMYIHGVCINQYSQYMYVVVALLYPMIV